MSTLRSFVSSVLPATKGSREQYWSKPDPMSENFELRVLHSRERKKIHFYEYYWAHHMEDTKLSHLGTWLWEMLFRKYSDIPDALKKIWLLIWGIGIGLLLTALMGGISLFASWLNGIPYLNAFLVVVAILLLIIQFHLIYTVGDAARYLSSNPRNIKVRQKIRSEGLDLLRSLHRSGRYSKIIVVGHSLGSVIAYDLISRLWIDYCDKFHFKKYESELEELLSSNAPPQPVLRTLLPNAGKKLSIDDTESLGEYRQLQHAARAEIQKWGGKWLISDLVTLGSPLAYGMLFMARSREDFAMRKCQRELPTCPPVEDAKGYAYSGKVPIVLNSGKKFAPLYYHHAAPFAVTSWTNIYFPAYFGIFGDFVGGPLRKEFGYGIKDIAVHYPGLAKFTIKTHISYWQFLPESPEGLDRPTPLAEIKRILGIQESKKQ